LADAEVDGGSDGVDNRRATEPKPGLPAPKRSNRQVALPSWDDILFGARGKN
jgi:hypothetical protein